MIDAHVHFWGREVAEADWLSGERTAPLRRAFDLAEYETAAAGSGVDGVVVVTAEQSTAESARLVERTANASAVLGVVGWVDLTGHVDGEDLASLRGIRHSVVAEEEGWLRRPDVRDGVAEFARTGLVLELLIAARDLPDVAACARDHPELPIVVDHLGDASVADTSWESGIRGLAAYDNVRVKLSGDHATTSSFGAVLDAFGPERMMVGSDWPVSTLRRPLDRELASLEALLHRLAPDEREHVLTRTAIATYGRAA
jgi:L-fuconolactonase